jgi:hypothetical protein
MEGDLRKKKRVRNERKKERQNRNVMKHFSIQNSVYVKDGNSQV